METLEKFYTGKFFEIPNYQRDYAWSNDNIDDLFEDVFEAIETNTAHYIGTFILSKIVDKDGTYNVVDGQQRLTTLSMIINALIDRLHSSEEKIINRFLFIENAGQHKLTLLNSNEAFFRDLMNGLDGIPENKSQRRLKDAYVHIETRIRALNGEVTPEIMLRELKRLEVMEFIEQNDGKAIRIFQTVNDRGKPLSNMEKAKSLLIYYSNRFLEGKLDDFVNQSFGQIFNHFNQIKGHAARNKVALVESKNFTEDNVMRYHFLAYDSPYYAYNASIGDVLEQFLKKILKDKKGNLESLRIFIQGYTQDLLNFFKAFESLMRSLVDPRRYKLFSILKVSTYLYPLVIRLEELNALEESLARISGKDFLDLIEIADVRVYKTRGTDPAKDVSFMAKDLSRANLPLIEKRLIDFVKWFMNDDEFASRLKGHMYGNQAQWHIFMELEDDLRKKENVDLLSIEELRNLNSQIPTIDHIYPQECPFELPEREFESDEHYLNINHKLGNLIVVEKAINSSCKNHLPDRKISDVKMYPKSQFECTRKFSASYMNSGDVFDAEKIEERTDALAQFCLRKWSI